MVLDVLWTDDVLAGHARSPGPGHAAPTNSNNADGSGGDLWPHALSEIKRSQLQTVGLGARGSIWQIAQKLSAALLYCDPLATTSHPLYLLLLYPLRTVRCPLPLNGIFLCLPFLKPSLYL